MKGQEAIDTTCNEDISTGNKKPLHELVQHWMSGLSFHTVFKMQLDSAEQPALTWQQPSLGQGAGDGTSMVTCSLMDPQDTPERRCSFTLR